MAEHMNIFAEAMAIPDTLVICACAGIVLVGMGCILGVIVKALEIMRSVKGNPSSEELQVSHQNLAERVSKIEIAIGEIQKDSEARAVDLHNRINPLVENTAAIRGGMEAFGKSFDNFTQMMTALIREREQRNHEHKS